MFVEPSLLAICMVAAFMAIPPGVVVSAGALAVTRGRRRYVLLGAAVAALLASAATMLLPLGATRGTGAALLIAGMITAIAAGVLLLLRKDGTVAATIVGASMAVLVTAGHLLYSARALAALNSPAPPSSAGQPSGEFVTALLIGQAAGTLTILVVATVLLLLHRRFEPIRGGIVLGALAAVVATSTQILLADVGTQVPPLTVTALGLVLGTLLGAMRADRSGALAGMPPGNH